MKKKTVEKQAFLIEVPAGEVEADLSTNSRKSMLEQKEPTLKDSQLELSMRDRMLQGLRPNHTPVKLRLARDGKHYELTMGFRRWAAAMRIGPETVIVGIDEGDKRSEAAIYRDRVDNLTENVQRVDLLPWELAESFSAIKTEFPHKTAAEIGGDTGFDKTYVNLLIRLKKNLSEALWEAYKIGGHKMNVQDLAVVAKSPKDEQEKAWNELLEEKRGGRPVGAETGSKAVPGKLATDKNLKLWLKKTKKAQKDQTGSVIFLEGVERGLSAALGECAFTLDEAD